MNTSDHAFVPVFDLRSIILQTEDNDIDELWSDEEEDPPISVDMSRGFPVIKLPFLLIPKTTYKKDDKILRFLHKIRGGIYDRLPPEVKDAVLMTLQLNNSVQEFFSKSVWRMFLQENRELRSEAKSKRRK